MIDGSLERADLWKRRFCGKSIHVDAVVYFRTRCYGRMEVMVVILVVMLMMLSRNSVRGLRWNESEESNEDNLKRIIHISDDVDEVISVAKSKSVEYVLSLLSWCSRTTDSHICIVRIRRRDWYLFLCIMRTRMIRVFPSKKCLSWSVTKRKSYDNVSYIEKHAARNAMIDLSTWRLWLYRVGYKQY